MFLTSSGLTRSSRFVLLDESSSLEKGNLVPFSLFPPLPISKRKALGTRLLKGISLPLTKIWRDEWGTWEKMQHFFFFYKFQPFLAVGLSYSSQNDWKSSLYCGAGFFF